MKKWSIKSIIKNSIKTNVCFSSKKNFYIAQNQVLFLKTNQNSTKTKFLFQAKKILKIARNSMLYFSQEKKIGKSHQIKFFCPKKTKNWKWYHFFFKTKLRHSTKIRIYLMPKLKVFITFFGKSLKKKKTIYRARYSFTTNGHFQSDIYRRILSMILFVHYW